MTSTENCLGPFRLGAMFVERVWGRRDLAPWYDKTFAEPTGEAWLTGEDCVVESGPHAGKTLSDLERECGEALLGTKHAEFPLLVKMLFPQEKLSVQVHPDDAHAAALGGDARAKTECWYVLEASPGASIALGLKPGTTEAMVRSVLGQEGFEALLQPLPVTAGDMVYAEAGTVHAIGAGLVLLEVQQSSDTTYRLYDYGRPRELHLETGMKVMKIETASGRVLPRVVAGGTRLIGVRHFVVDRFDVAQGGSIAVQGMRAPECLIGLQGTGVVIGAGGDVELRAGQAVVVPACCENYRVEGECSFVRCSVPGSES